MRYHLLTSHCTQGSGITRQGRLLRFRSPNRRTSNPLEEHYRDNLDSVQSQIEASHDRQNRRYSHPSSKDLVEASEGQAHG